MVDMRNIRFCNSSTCLYQIDNKTFDKETTRPDQDKQAHAQYIPLQILIASFANVNF